MSNLELYYQATCPYCCRVLDFMRANGIEMPLKSTTEAANRETLIAVGGSRQVPCLFIDGAPLYESGDIIEYLRENCCE